MSEFDVHVGSSKLYGWNGTREREIGIDPVTRALMAIDYAHAEAHKQSAYLAVHSALANDTDFIEIRIGTADTEKRAHVSVFFEAALAATVQLWPNTTKTDVVLNRVASPNRYFDSTNTTNLTICHTPGGSQAGDAVITRYIGSASTSGRADVGGSGGNRGEFILGRNKAYLFKLTSRADNNALTLFFDYYLHTDKPA